MKKRWKVSFYILILLLLLRIILPHFLLYSANKELSKLKGYYGHIDDIYVSVFSASYQIDHAFLKKITDNDTIDFIVIKHMDLGLEWKPIINGHLVGKVKMESSELQITNELNDFSDIIKDTAHFRYVLNKLMPIDINILEINNGSIRYKDPFSSPLIDLKLTNLRFVALNLSNGYDSLNNIPSTLKSSAKLLRGKLNLKSNFDPFSFNRTFDLNASLMNLDLVLLNDFMHKYANIDVNKGKLNLFAEFAANKGRFKGYIKPLVTELDVVEFKKEEGSFLQIAYESIIGGNAWVFKNSTVDQQGIKLNVEGKFDDPKFGVIDAILSLLKNAFIVSLKPAIEKEIDLNAINKVKDETFIDKLFRNSDERKAAKSRKEKLEKR